MVSSRAVFLCCRQHKLRNPRVARLPSGRTRGLEPNLSFPGDAPFACPLVGWSVPLPVIVLFVYFFRNFFAY
jgi:hypothetical protein